MIKNGLILITCVILTIGCAATKVQPGASTVLVSPDKPDPSCKYLGAVTGGQGNFWTGNYTSNKNLEKGALADLQNNAHNLGANYVQLTTSHTGTSTDKEYNVVKQGNAYKCDNLNN